MRRADAISSCLTARVSTTVLDHVDKTRPFFSSDIFLNGIQKSWYSFSVNFIIDNNSLHHRWQKNGMGMNKCLRGRKWVSSSIVINVYSRQEFIGQHGDAALSLYTVVITFQSFKTIRVVQVSIVNSFIFFCACFVFVSPDHSLIKTVPSIGNRLRVPRATQLNLSIGVVWGMLSAFQGQYATSLMCV